MSLTALFAALLGALAASSAPAQVRPGAEDAACDALALRWRVKERRVDARERNFFLFDAADLGCAALVRELVEKGAAVGARDRAGNAPFLLAARKGHVDVMDYLVERGAELDTVNRDGSSALLLAVVDKRRRALRRLLELGLDPNRANRRGLTPLIAAAYNGDARAVAALLEAGAEPTALDASGKGALVYAAGRGFVRVVEALLATGRIDVDARYANALTALMWAAGHSNDVPGPEGLVVVETLLEAGADVEPLDARGRSALHIAAERGHAAIARRLVEVGAEPELRDREGRRAIDLAPDAKTRAALAP